MLDTSRDALWHLQLFGGLTLRRKNSASTGQDGEIGRFRTRKVGSLLAYLVLNPEPQSREVLSTLLWPDVEREQGLNNLRVSLSALRSQIEPAGTIPGGVLNANRQAVQLRAEAFTSDAHQFQQACKRFSAPLNEESAAELRRAFELYRGSLLSGYYDEWSQPLALYLESLYEQVTRRLISWHLDRGEDATALSLGCRAAQLLSGHEEFARLVAKMRGRADQDVARAPGAAAPPVGPAVETPSGDAVPAGPPADQLRPAAPLPFYPTSFLGRQSELETLVQSVRSPGTMALLILAGPPAIGKTRLAVEAARAVLAADPPARVHFVSLSSLDSPTAIADALRAALNLPASLQIDPLDQVVAALCEECQVAAARGGKVLLVLDNLEHLLPEAALAVAALRARIPALTIWATSRALLRLPGEEVLLVQGLPYPAAEAVLEEILESPSVRLFIQRARSARPGFAVTPSNAGALLELCRQLEGWPLSLELAAARSHSFTPAQMVAQISCDRDFLQRRVARDDIDVARQSSLDAAIHWSYRLLDAPAREFFAKLAVFRGGANAGQIGNVTGNEDVLARLAELTAHSLVTCEEKAGMLRYGLLEGVRQFARRQFDEREWLELGRRHAESYAALLSAGRMQGTARAAGRQKQLDEERDNLRAALEWAAEHDAALLLEISSRLWPYWDSRGLIPEGKKWLRTALNAKTAGVEPGRGNARIEAFNGLARLHFSAGEFEDGLQAAEEALKLARAARSQRGIAHALLGQGLIRLYQGEITAARGALEQSSRTFEACGDLAGEARALTYHGFAQTFGGAYDQTFVTYQQAVEKAREAGDATSLALALFFCGDVLGPISGDYQAAKAYFSESFLLGTENGDAMARIYANWGLCRCAIALDDLAAAQLLYHAMDRFCIEAGFRWGQVFVVETAAAMAVSRGDWEPAAIFLGAAEAAREALVLPLTASYYVEFDRIFAPLWHRLPPRRLQGKWRLGRGYTLEEALALARAPRLELRTSDSQEAGEPLAADDNPLGFPLDRRRARPLLAESHYGCGRLALLRGRRAAAREHGTRALGLWRELGDTQQADSTHSWMEQEELL